eukprot:TRINITY_DN12403_c0_g1_i1.p1 TRINITY_DN12403_c0_g1~~TRINITY_DN12403_c0_g1_i1.p1  ORF type:complete len:201 (+),score=60.08 TRINITY_DN12403_c0_g1_i1:47-649(+)
MGEKTSVRETSMEVVIAMFSVLALAWTLTANLGFLPALFGERAETKKFESYEEFYPHYLSEHSDATCRLLHFIGTSMVVLWLFVWNMGTAHRSVALIALAGAVGNIVQEMTKGVPTAQYEALGMAVVFFIGSLVLNQRISIYIVTMILGYGFAWVGHFQFEKNKPATWTYTTWSLMSDFRMYYEILNGSLTVALPKEMMQ